MAEACWTDAADVFRASGDTNRLASILNNVAELEGLRGDAVAAVARHEQVLVLRQQLRDPIGLAQSLVNLGKAVQQTGDLARARTLLEDGLARLRRLGIERDIGACLYNLALLARAAGEVTEAAQFAGESLTIKHTAGEWFDVAQCLELLAGLAVDRGGGLRAARLLGAASALRRSIGARPSTDEADASTIYDTVRDALGQDGLAAGIAEGESWSLARAMAEATEIALVSSSAGIHRAGRTSPSSVPTPAVPIKNMVRTATRDVELRGQLIHEGDELMLLYPSANRDEDVFDEPFRFDSARTPNEHVAFGFGTHFCLGASLARLEIAVMLDELLARPPTLRHRRPRRRRSSTAPPTSSAASSTSKSSGESDVWAGSHGRLFRTDVGV